MKVKKKGKKKVQVKIKCSLSLAGSGENEFAKNQQSLSALRAAGCYLFVCEE